MKYQKEMTDKRQLQEAEEAANSERIQELEEIVKELEETMSHSRVRL